jgi:hypothetical protein
LRSSNRLTAAVSLKNLLGLEPATISGDEAEPCVVSTVLVEPMQQLDEAELTNGRGAEPKNNLIVVRVTRKSTVTLVKLGSTFPGPEA